MIDTTMPKNSIRLATIGTCLLMALSLAACNTVEGAGKDVKSAGQSIEKTADQAK